MEISLSTFPELHNEFDLFFKYYDIERFIVPPSRKVTGLKQKENRVCRFCGTSNTAGKFRTEAHIIPQLLGNQYLIGDFECDECNNYFSAFESDLSNFLGIGRTFNAVINNKNKAPNFHSPNNNITAKKIPTFSERKVLMCSGKTLLRKVSKSILAEKLISFTIPKIHTHPLMYIRFL